jgi:hypothetical protein
VGIFFKKMFLCPLLLPSLNFIIMRGQKVFKELVGAQSLGAPAQKGRNNKLVAKRNECLAARYYYYAFYRNMCYEEIIRQLVSEFFLAPNTIVNIIQDHTDVIRSLREKALVKYSFQTKWPHLKW